ncbi:MAG TPA: DJ-1/PfpI family protein [Solirubrobacterales bacterium]|nr:DJ-1/PfpI family protein [Solirubrobacterales bacterium]
MRIEIVVFDGFDELDAIGPLEILRNLAVGKPEVNVALVTPEPAAGVLASHGLRIEVDGVLSDGADLLLVPGGGWAQKGEHGVHAEIARGDLPRRIAAAHAGGATVAGVCTGVLLLGAAGLLEGRRATTLRRAHEQLAGYGARVLDERVVDDGDVITCGGVTSGLDLAFWLVEREFGSSHARAIAAGMEYERRGGVYIGSGGARSNEPT